MKQNKKKMKEEEKKKITPTQLLWFPRKKI